MKTHTSWLDCFVKRTYDHQDARTDCKEEPQAWERLRKAFGRLSNEAAQFLKEINVNITLTSHGECRPRAAPLPRLPASAVSLLIHRRGGPGTIAECKSQKAAYVTWHEVQRDSSPNLASCALLTFCLPSFRGTEGAGGRGNSYTSDT